MAVHVICPSLRCRKILELPDNVRGRTVTCRYCSMEFRVPQIRRRPLDADRPGIVSAQRYTIKVQ